MSISKLILEELTSPGRREHFAHLSEEIEGAQQIKIVSPYVTHRTLICPERSQSIHLLTSLTDENLMSGATSIDSIRSLIKCGVECRSLELSRALHAKVYIFDDRKAVITSANLTEAALRKNIEAGVVIKGDAVKKILLWSRQLWSMAVPISLTELGHREERILELRRKYQALRKELKTLSSTSKERDINISRIIAIDVAVDGVKYFLCNSNRKNADRKGTAGFLHEERMLQRGFAVAWEPFNFPGHMTMSRIGDVVFLYAKGCGVIAIGRVIGSLERLRTGEPGALGNDIVNDGIVEWRLPVDWLFKVEDSDAAPIEPLNSTFHDISDVKHVQRIEGIISHFA
jgi:hypothetical protein